MSIPHTRLRRDSYLRLINYCLYSILVSLCHLPSIERGLSFSLFCVQDTGPESLAPRPRKSTLNINLPLHCPLLLLTYLTDFYFYCFLRPFTRLFVSPSLLLIRPAFSGPSPRTPVQGLCWTYVLAVHTSHNLYNIHSMQHI